MSDVTASGFIGAQIEAVRYMFAASATFKTLTGTASTADAHAFTFANWQTGHPSKPFVVVTRGALSRSRYANRSWQTEASIVVHFEYVQATDPNLDFQAAITNCENYRDAIMAEVEALAATTISYGTGLAVVAPNVQGWRVIEEGVRVSDPHESAYHAVGTSVELSLSTVYG